MKENIARKEVTAEMTSNRETERKRHAALISIKAGDQNTYMAVIE